MNLFKNTNNNKRYYTLDYFYHQLFGCKVFKVSLNGNFTCPNIDGTVGTKGCTYCSSLGSGEFAGNPKDDLVTQFNDVKNILLKKWPKAKYIGYFQANTNTYAPLSILKEKYETILKLDDVVGLSIATRPDAISDEVLDYLEELSKRTYLTIELGLQTIHEETSYLINRCHSLKCFHDMVLKLNQRNINVVVHIINGLPYETKDMMLETARYLNTIKIQGVKIHMLHLVKGTKMADDYKMYPFHILTKEEYINIVCNQLEILNSNIVINRITGDPKADDLIEPNWLIKKFSVLNDIDKELVRRNTYQGFNENIENKINQIIMLSVKENDLIITNKAESLLNNIIINGKIINVKEISNNNFYKNYYQKISFVNLDIKDDNYDIIRIIKDILPLLNHKGSILLELKNKSEILEEYLKSINDYNISYYYNDKYLILIKKNRL